MSHDDPTLSAPYRFVPVSEEIHAPEWGAFADGADASGMVGPHDIPFEDGITGEIALTIETLSPLFIGAEKKDDDGKVGTKERFEVSGAPAIPGTSVKGAIRSVLEAATFGNIRDRIDDRRLSIRDLHNTPDYLTHMTRMFEPLSRAGWLTSAADGTWHIQPCHWSLVKQDDLEILAGAGVKLGRKRETAPDKYKTWGGRPLDVDFTPLQPSTEGDFAKGRKLSRATALGSGRSKGTIVFTGQPAKRPQINKQGKDVAKKTEFIFHGTDGDAFEVEPDQRRDFEGIHRDPNKGTPNAEWAHWQKTLNAGDPVPIFWLPDDRAKNGLRGFGLAMMFRLPYKHSIREAAPQKFDRTALTDTPYDMADLIFGAVNAEKHRTLKGRANFTLFKAEPGWRDGKTSKQILLAPKPGFYPAYVRQQKIDRTPSVPPKVPETWITSDDSKSRKSRDYTTYHAEGAWLRGFKRYPVGRSGTQDNVSAKVGNREDENTKVGVWMTPVAPGATFTGTLRVFNLRKVELGALIWALTWGGRETHAHRMGGGKPLGWGECRITVDAGKTALLENTDWTERSSSVAQTLLDEAHAAFIDYMNEVQKGAWELSEAVTELLATADRARGAAMDKTGLLTGMNDPKAFVVAKKEGFALPVPSADNQLEQSAAPASLGNKPGGSQGGGHQRKQVEPLKEQARFGWLYRKGDSLELDTGEIATVLDDVAEGAKTFSVDIEGDIETISPSEVIRKR